MFQMQIHQIEAKLTEQGMWKGLREEQVN